MNEKLKEEVEAWVSGCMDTEDLMNWVVADIMKWDVPLIENFIGKDEEERDDD